jgi:quinone-modifying oxidoreductase, subunit QmoC
LSSRADNAEREGIVPPSAASFFDNDDSWGDLQRSAGVFQCLQCHKCSAGCPVGDSRDLQTSQIVRLTQIGDRASLFGSAAIWRCTGCHTCTTRCPAGVDPARLQDLLKRRSLEAGHTPADSRTFVAADAFLATIRRHGRLFELGLVRRFKMRTRSFFERLALGIVLFLRGKLKLRPRRMSDRRSVKALIDAQRIRPDDR